MDGFLAYELAFAALTGCYALLAGSAKLVAHCKHVNATVKTWGYVKL